MLSRSRVPFHKLLIFFAMAWIAVIAWAWLKRERIGNWVGAETQKRVVQSYIDRVQPRLPFKVEKFAIDSHWKDFRSGRISRLAVTLSRPPFRVRLEGPVDLDWNSKDSEWTGIYAATVFWEGPTQIAPMKLRLEISATKSLTQIHEIQIQASTPKTQNPSTTDFALEARWSNEKWKAHLQARSFAWTDSTHPERALNLDHPSFAVEGPMSLAPFSLDGIQTFRAEGEGLEALWDKAYFDLPISHAPLQGELVWKQGPGRLTLRTLGQELRVESAHLSWDLRKIPVRETMAFFSGVPELAWTQAIQWKSGTVSSSGQMRIGGSSWIENLKGTARIHDLGLRWNENKLALKGLSAELPLELLSPASAPDTSPRASARSRFKLAIDKVYFQKFAASLAPTEIFAQRDPEGGIAIDSGTPVALRFPGIPLRIGRISGLLKGESSRWVTSLGLEPTAIERFRTGLCWDKKALPPANLSLDFPKVELDPEMIDPRGKITLRLFDGALVIEDLAFFDYLSQVPEIDFSARWNGIRLDRMGDWLGFGEMDGYLNGYAKDVTFESWFPTHYDLLAQAKPLAHSDIVFSPDAMKNFVQIFAGEDVSLLMPGFARWLAFGWPSRVFGGYDVKYVGVRAFSADGSIMVETLDPNDRDGHFVLKGDRFKMPLHTQRYPLIMDATALGNFVRQVAKQLDRMAQEKKKESSNGKSSETPDDEIEKPCLPPEVL